jgi:Zn finger protein HypA/HybF involved in hydrogenase expression
MHEGSIAEELVEEAVARAKDTGITRITRVRVRLGVEGHVTGEALSSWFDLAKAGTIAGEAVLEIDQAEGKDIVLMSLEGVAPDAPEHS